MLFVLLYFNLFRLSSSFIASDPGVEIGTVANFTCPENYALGGYKYASQLEQIECKGDGKFNKPEIWMPCVQSKLYIIK